MFRFLIDLEAVKIGFFQKWLKSHAAVVPANRAAFICAEKLARSFYRNGKEQPTIISLRLGRSAVARLDWRPTAASTNLPYPTFPLLATANVRLR